ncbi:MAG: hypothetical protein EXS11_08525, partial [Gemmataceae bacterium]|nr:hypothetical protein [Gemmataceae bacterium]
MTSLFASGAEQILFPILAQLVVILISARIMGYLMRFLGQPEVVGEIAAGLLLGPSFLGMWFPAIQAQIFPAVVEGVGPGILPAILTVLAQLGLLVLLFQVGLEFDFSHLKWSGMATFSISATGIVFPFGLGLLLAWFIHDRLGIRADGTVVDFLPFALFIGTAMSITALPILGRLMIEWGITRTRLATITISAAALDDAVGWIILATVAAIASSAFEPLRLIGMIGASVGFFLLMLLVVAPLIRNWLGRLMAKSGGEVSMVALSICMVLVFMSAMVTSKIGIFAIFGAFIAGAVLSPLPGLREAVSRRLREFTTAFFLPIFFAYTGLRTNIGSLNDGYLWGICALVMAAAISGKLLGCLLAAKISGYPWRESMLIGVLMNTRALMELIVI